MQTRLRDYHNDLTSFNHNVFNFIHRPGRFWGFDVLSSVSGLHFKLNHTAGGFSYENDLSETIGPFGLLLTPQGVLVSEDAETPQLTADTNSGNSFVRYDLVVFNHSFISVAGDNPGTYSIIKGPLSSLNKPTPTAPDFQTILGYLKIPAGATNLTGATWIPQKAPDSGDNFDARLSDPNSFMKTQNFSQLDDSTDIAIAPSGYGISGSDFILFKPNGNAIVWFPSVDQVVGSLSIADFAMDNGLEFSMLINDHVKILERASLTGETAANFRTFKISERDVFLDGSDRYLYIPAGKKALARVILLNDIFYFQSVNYIDFAPRQDYVKVGMVIDVDMALSDMNANFDATGLGINDWEGYCLPNGNTYPLPLGGTKTVTDCRGRARITTSNLLASGAPAYNTLLGTYLIGNVGGSQSAVLSQTHLPHVKIEVPVTVPLTTTISDGSTPPIRITTGQSEPAEGDALSLETDFLGDATAFSILGPWRGFVTVEKLY